MHHFRKH